MTTTFFHIGPYKTGTTSFQEAMWRNRSRLREHGILYPNTGLHQSQWGPRHFRLAEYGTEKTFRELFSEIDSAKGVTKAVVSSERLSRKMSAFVKNLETTANRDVKLVVAVRNEVDLAKSMYLQGVKSYYWRHKKKKNRNKVEYRFDDWFVNNRLEFDYSLILNKWGDVFGRGEIIFVPYLKDVDIVDALADAMHIDRSLLNNRSSRSNPSIGAFAERCAQVGRKFGHVGGFVGMHFGRIAEEFFPGLRSRPLAGFNRCEVDQYYTASRERAFEDFPGFREAYEKVQNQALHST